MDNTVECQSVRVRNAVEGIENLFKKDYVFCLLITGSRYIFLCLAAKKTRTDGVRSVCQTLISVVVCSGTQHSGVYRKLVEKGLRFCLLLTGSRYIFLRVAAKKTRTDGAELFVRDLFLSSSV